MSAPIRNAPLVVVAMSGGVDSAVAAALLLEAGYRVRGASLRLWDSTRVESERICSDSRDAAKVASHLGIVHDVIDQRREFDLAVVRPFVEDCVDGRTPNPCVACNSDFKLGVLLDWAIANDAAFLATGHYARTEKLPDGQVRLLRGRDPGRDQSYFLFRLSQRQLARSRFPLGDLTKGEVRAHARRLGIPVAGKADSQDLCFGGPAEFAAARGKGGRRGDVVDVGGRVLGSHEGIEGFTIGQRRGLGVSSRGRQYVHRIDSGVHQVMVSDRRPRSSGLIARDWHWIGSPASERERLTLRVRYRHEGAEGTVSVAPGGRSWRIAFDEPVTAVAPGQAVVAYRSEEVVGGGWIVGPVDRGE